jgi:transcriptional regulator with XRE-family HTH domain
MSAVTSALPHAPDLQSFLKPREQPSVNILTRMHAETRTNADIAIATAEGDTVVLSAGAVLQTAYASYDARGRLAGQGFNVHAEAAQLVVSQDTAMTVAGDLSDAELADVHHLLAKLGAMAVDFRAGELDDAVTHVLDLGELDTLANFDASFEYVQHVRVEQHYTAQENLCHTPASTEKPVSSARISPKSIERLLDSMMQVAELAKRSGIPQATISRIESGKHKMPVITTIQAIARVLGDGSQAREVEIFLQLTQALSTSFR